MSYRVAIEKLDTGEIRLHEIEMEWDDHCFYQWLEGNYSCDCNREMFFDQAGDGGLEWGDVSCSEGRFKALYVELEDGSRGVLDGRPGW